MEDKDLGDLDELSRSFADALFVAIPELRAHARAEDGVLRIDLTPRPEGPRHAFWVWTDDEEVTVGFGMFHTHFDWSLQGPVSPDDPIGFIRSLMSDELLVEEWTLDGRWSGSSTLEASEEPDLRGLKPGHVVYLRSWSGALDREIRGG